MNPILNAQPLGFVWPTVDPFLFCVHHDDPYPRGNGRYGPDAPLTGHDIGQDFDNPDGWRMYHGQQVPGFPAHPHRGFETVTVVRRGYIDHADSLGAAARYGMGDVQWLTAGAGVVHAEMFPLLDNAAPNPVELFQIWLNLPASHKMSPPHFTMFWADEIPRRRVLDAQGRATDLSGIAGQLDDSSPPPLAPPPDSWAAQAGSDLAIWTLRLDPGARFRLPAARGQGTRRHLYFFAGRQLVVAGQTADQHMALELRADQPVDLQAGPDEVQCLLLQGKPIGEPVAQHGPFVMNTQAEIRQAFADYQRTQFGGWPWPDPAPVHGPEAARFARQADGRVEQPAKAG